MKITSKNTQPDLTKISNATLDLFSLEECESKCSGVYISEWLESRIAHHYDRISSGSYEYQDAFISKFRDFRVGRSRASLKNTGETESEFSGSIVFAPQIETHFNSMFRLANEFYEEKHRCLFLVPNSCVNWKKYHNATERFEFVFVENLIQVNTTFDQRKYLLITHDLESMKKRESFTKFSFWQWRSFRMAVLRDARRFLALVECLNLRFAAHKPRCIVGPNPWGLVSNAVLAAGKEADIPLFYQAHVMLFQTMTDLYSLYDLRIYDHFIVKSHRCAQAIWARDSKACVCVEGLDISAPNWNAFSLSPEGQHSCQSRFVVGIPETLNADHIAKIVSLLSSQDIDIVIKTHPPSGRAGQVRKVVGGGQTVRVLDHSEIDLAGFFQQTDIMICGSTTVAYEAAAVGIPVICFYSARDQEVIQKRSPALPVHEIALWHVHDFEGLAAMVYELSDRNVDSLHEARVKQFERFRLYFPEDESSCAVHFIESHTL